MRIVKTWRGEPFIMNEDIKDMENWNQKFGNTFAMVLGMCFVFAFIMFFYEGCSWRKENGADNVLAPEEKETSEHKFLHTDFNASDWILFK